MHSYLSVPALMFVTLGIVLAVAVILLVRYHSRNDSHPMRGKRDRNIDEIRRGVPPGK